jgi:rhodanese-related sulfurtransferase
MNLPKAGVILFMIALITVIGCGKQMPYGEIGPLQILDRLEQKNITIIDVREGWEYDGGRIPGAILIPLGELKKNYREFDKDAEIILVCRSGNRSGNAAQFLANKGFKNVYNLVGGMLSWSGAVETGK